MVFLMNKLPKKNLEAKIIKTKKLVINPIKIKAIDFKIKNKFNCYK